MLYEVITPGVPIPRVLRLHRDDLGRDEIEKIHGVPVTTPLRSILDLWQSEQVPRRITSYNVCYTKLLRGEDGCPSGN